MEVCVLSLNKDYLVVDYDNIGSYPTMVFNHDPSSKSSWKHVPTRMVPPAASCTSGISFMITGRESALLPAALLNGVWLSKDDIQNIIVAEKLEYPAGTGRVLKPDLVDFLLSKILPDEPEDVLARIKKTLVGAKKQPTTEADDEEDLNECPESILEVLEHLDIENKEHFKNVAEQAGRILKRKKESKAEKEKNAEPPEGLEPELVPPPEHDAEAPPGAGAGVARVAVPRAHPGVRRASPQELQALLPPATSGKIYLKWQPQHRRISAEFPRF